MIYANDLEDESKSNVGCVIEWFLHKEYMSQKKIQKLAYYAQAWSVTLDSVDIVPGIEFEAWIHGPVNTEIWHKCKSFGWREIMIAEDEQQQSYELINEALSNRQKEILELVWDTYGGYSANELEMLTHSEAPWKNARKGLGEFSRSTKKISRDDMKEYYINFYGS